MKAIYNAYMIKYKMPDEWIKYDNYAITTELVMATSSILTLRSIPYQRDWVEDLQQMELKREVAGTSRIEGAEFTEQELDEALRETPAQLLTRSQKQAHAAVITYRWIANIPEDMPINEDLILEIHRRIVTGADDDHCEPGALRKQDENVNFGQPRHRGVDGGPECKSAFAELARAIQRTYPDHDPIIQALAAHYHLAAMHPFLDGNGRTARALEALLLQRAGLRDTCFIAMSNYYYDEKIAYLDVLAVTGANGHDLTTFLKFALNGIALQSRRVLEQTRIHVQKALFRNLMHNLFGRLRTPRKRVIAERQLEILRFMLDAEHIKLAELYKKSSLRYSDLKTPDKAFIRDLLGLETLGAIEIVKEPDEILYVKLRLEWPTEITETDFMNRIKALPKAKTRTFVIE